MSVEEVLKDILGDALQHDEPMSRHTTLKVGGPAKWFWAASDIEKLSDVLHACDRYDVPFLFLGHGSNVLMSDYGYDGLVIKNRCKATRIGPETYSECGVSFGSLFYQTAKEGLSGLEWAIGIPGTVGGALVSNAGAYRGNIGPLVKTVRVYSNRKDEVVGPEWMEFSYRDSRLRRNGVGREVILSCTLNLEPGGDPDEILARAKEYQAQRRAKQPFYPSAGSFFKNVTDRALAESLPDLPRSLKEAGVVPTGHLNEICGLKGLRVGNAQVSEKHANFLVNLGGATATDIRTLASLVKASIRDRFGVEIEEEVLYLGDWSRWTEPVAAAHA